MLISIFPLTSLDSPLLQIMFSGRVYHIIIFLTFLSFIQKRGYIFHSIIKFKTRFRSDFTDQVTESRQKAEAAASDVPAIQSQVLAAEEGVTSITEELFTASDRANEARDMALQAQKQFALKASEVITKTIKEIFSRTSKVERK